MLVIACGGGGIPIARKNGQPVGVEAVIDKDRASALLASRLGVDLFVISTDTDFVYLDYKKPDAASARHQVAPPISSATSPPDISRPEAWVRRSNRSCAFCAKAAQQAIIASAENLRLAVRAVPAHTCSLTRLNPHSSQTNHFALPLEAADHADRQSS